MKILNSLENKSKFNGLYLYQKVAYHKEYGKEVANLEPIRLDTSCKYVQEDYSLLLNPLSKMKKKDAIEVAKIICGHEYEKRNIKLTVIPTPIGKNKKCIYVLVEIFISHPAINNFKNLKLIQIDTTNGEIVTGIWNEESNSFIDGFTENYSFAMDFIRSKSYATSYMNLSVKDLVKLGWITLK